MFRSWIHVPRCGADLLLPVHYRAADALARLRTLSWDADRQAEPAGHVFLTIRRPREQISESEGRKIMLEALNLSGIGATREDLLAAYAFHLRKRNGYTMPDLREALGYSEVKHVRGLLAGHVPHELRERARQAQEVES